METGLRGDGAGGQHRDQHKQPAVSQKTPGARGARFSERYRLHRKIMHALGSGEQRPGANLCALVTPGYLARSDRRRGFRPTPRCSATGLQSV
jgi:hypothetical protein